MKQPQVKANRFIGKAMSADVASALSNKSASLSTAQGNLDTGIDFRSGTLRAPLHVGRTDDALEKQADRVADRFVHSGHSGRVAADSTPNRESLSLLVSIYPPGERMAQSTSAVTSFSSSKSQSTLAGLPRSHGHPIPIDQRRTFEAAFAHDFTDVRLFTDPRAASMAASMGAAAFTHGPNIAFGAGRYAPTTTRGRRLLAHELAHVVQQRRGGVWDIQTDPDRDLGRSAEVLAESVPQRPPNTVRLVNERDQNVYAPYRIYDVNQVPDRYRHLEIPSEQPEGRFSIADLQARQRENPNASIRVMIARVDGRFQLAGFDVSGRGSATITGGWVEARRGSGGVGRALLADRITRALRSGVGRMELVQATGHARANETREFHEGVRRIAGVGYSTRYTLNTRQMIRVAVAWSETLSADERFALQQLASREAEVSSSRARGAFDPITRTTHLRVNQAGEIVGDFATPGGRVMHSRVPRRRPTVRGSGARGAAGIGGIIMIANEFLAPFGQALESQRYTIAQGNAEIEFWESLGASPETGVWSHVDNEPAPDDQQVQTGVLIDNFYLPYVRDINIENLRATIPDIVDSYYDYELLLKTGVALDAIQEEDGHYYAVVNRHDVPGAWKVYRITEALTQARVQAMVTADEQTREALARIPVDERRGKVFRLKPSAVIYRSAQGGQPVYSSIGNIGSDAWVREVGRIEGGPWQMVRRGNWSGRIQVVPANAEAVRIGSDAQYKVFQPIEDVWREAKSGGRSVEPGELPTHGTMKSFRAGPEPGNASRFGWVVYQRHPDNPYNLTLARGELKTFWVAASDVEPVEETDLTAYLSI